MGEIGNDDWLSDYNEPSIYRPAAKKNMGRGAFLKVGGTAVAGGFLAWVANKLGVVRGLSELMSSGGIENGIPNPTGTTVVPTEATTIEVVTTQVPPMSTPTPENTASTKTEETTVTLDGGVKMVLRSDGIPKKMILPDGRIEEFDRTKWQEVWDKAANTGEPAMFGVAVWETTDQPKTKRTGSTERPITTEIPDDVLSDEELTQRGVTIIPSENVSMYVRPGAFDGGELLSVFTAGGDDTITIVLIDASVVLANFMADKRYDGVRGVVAGVDTEAITRFREETATDLFEAIRIARTELASATTTAEKESIWEYMLMCWHYAEDYLHTKSDDEILTTMPYPGEPTSVAGIQTSDADGQVVVVAVGGPRESRASLMLACLPDGRWMTDYFAPNSFGDNRLRESHSYPDPKDYTSEDPNHLCDQRQSGEYPIGGVNPEIATRHELVHGLSEIRSSRDGTDDLGECRTDQEALLSLVRAHQRWVDSGYTDNRGYYIVFKLEDGSIILTKNEMSGRQVN